MDQTNHSSTQEQKVMDQFDPLHSSHCSCVMLQAFHNVGKHSDDKKFIAIESRIYELLTTEVQDDIK